MGAVVLVGAVACGGGGVTTSDDGTTGGDPPATASSGDSDGPGMSNTGTPDDDGVATTISGMDDADDSDGSGTPGDGSDDAAASTTIDDGSTTDGGDDDVLELDPATLVYFELPIGSLRYAIGGQDVDSDTCVTVVWFYPDGEVCGSDGTSPYVIVTPNATAPCEEWDYAGNVQVDSVDGCVEFIPGESLTAIVTMMIEVTGAPFTGTILLDNQ